MPKDVKRDIYGELNYAPITLFAEKLNVGVIGAGRGALLKTRNYYNKGAHIEVLALDFLEDFYKFDRNKVTLVKESYTTDFIRDKHIIIIAIDDEKLTNKIKIDCESQHKIYINSSNFKDGMGVVPVSRESKYVSVAVNTKLGNPRGAVMIADSITEYIAELDEYIELTSKVRNSITIEKNIKEGLLKFINSRDCKYFYDKNKIISVLKLFYNDEIVNKISFLGKEE